jgi:hypothetical protein
VASHRCVRRSIAVAAAVLACAGAPRVYADVAGYAGVRDIVVEDAQLRVEHHHDWSGKTRKSRWKMISTHQDPFRSDNDYASLTVTDKKTGQQLFRVPVPALTDLWISPDSRYVLGLSEIKVWNPVQVVLYDRAGRRLLARSIEVDEAAFTPEEFEKLLRKHPKARGELERVCHREEGRVFVNLGEAPDGTWDVLYRHLRPSHLSPNFSESVSNWVYWFDSEAPKPALIEEGGRVTFVELRDPKKRPFRIPVPELPAR